MLQLAASLAYDIPVSLGEAITGIDRRKSVSWLRASFTSRGNVSSRRGNRISVQTRSAPPGVTEPPAGNRTSAK
jgi:hypothetical protein